MNRHQYALTDAKNLKMFEQTFEAGQLLSIHDAQGRAGAFAGDPENFHGFGRRVIERK